MRTVLLVALGLSITGCAGNLTPKVVIDKADSTAYVSTRAFQEAEEIAWHAKAPWPSAAQHQVIGTKLSGIYQSIIDVANIGLALPPGTTLSLADLAAVAQLEQLVVDLSTLISPPAVPTAPTAATTTAKPTATAAKPSLVLVARWTAAKNDLTTLTAKVKGVAK
jgi:hypothetical protein